MNELGFKKKKIGLVASCLFLAACGAPEKSTKPQSEEEKISDTVITGDTNDRYYRPLLDENGQYKMSKNRGITTEMNSPTNMSLIEKDLARLSQEEFDTEDYLIQEGQYLPPDLVSTWLGRESKDNPDGLNPEQGGKGDNRAPNYISTIVEYDLYKKTKDGVKLAGIAIGLGMNSVDYYPEYQYGPILEQEISRQEVMKNGKDMANTVIARTRQIDGAETVPILIGVFEQSARDDLGGGVFLTVGKSENGDPKVASWNNLNEKRLIFPLEGDNTAEENAFSNFKSEIENFFPNVSGVTGQAHYVDDALVEMKINITPHFYGRVELISFTQLIHQAASNFLPKEGSTEIVVESLNGIEAILIRHAGEKDYQSYVLN